MACQALWDLMKPEIDKAITKARDKAIAEARDKAIAEARAEFVGYVMKDKNCSAEEAERIIENFLAKRSNE